MGYLGGLFDTKRWAKALPLLAPFPFEPILSTKGLASVSQPTEHGI